MIVYRIIAFLLLALAVLPSAGSAQEPGLVRHTLLDGRITLDLPALLAPMSEAMKRIKYSGRNRPIAAFSDSTAAVSVALGLTEQRIEAGSIPLHTARLRSQMERVPRILRWYASDALRIDGREVGLLDFDSQAIDSEIRNKMLLFELDGRLLILTFNMTKQREAEWAPIADRAIRGLKFR